MDDVSPSPHRRAWDLIPWVVGGSASEADSDWLARHAAECADCREELAFHRSLRAGMAADGPAPTEVDPALDRLWARIDRADPATEDLRPPPAAARRGGWSRLLVAAVLMEAIGLAALAGIVWERPRAADYQTLSRPAPLPSPASIRLVPAATLPLGELRALLARSGLQIVESSGDGAILGLAQRAGAPTVAPAVLLARLRAEPGVLLAEPIIDAPASPR